MQLKNEQLTIRVGENYKTNDSFHMLAEKGSDKEFLTLIITTLGGVGSNRLNDEIY